MVRTTDDGADAQKPAGAGFEARMTRRLSGPQSTRSVGGSRLLADAGIEQGSNAADLVLTSPEGGRQEACWTKRAPSTARAAT
jgi:hypothetical protein